ncbi:MAG: TOMM precursor leader peptide-binding protein [Pseudonocardiaceae bacterium]|nr:TOMM precursor leader peptide-binding protein [Pseudonocardiaceae bacterium]
MDLRAATAQLVGFKRHLQVDLTEDGAYLFSERGVTKLEGERIAALAALLDGTRDIASVLRARPGGMAAEHAASLIAQLMEAGLVTAWLPGERSADDRELAFWEAGDVDPAVAATDVVRRVGLLAVGEAVDAEAIAPALRSCGLAVTTGSTSIPSQPIELSIVLCDDYLDPRLAEIDAAHRAAKQPWLLAKPTGRQLWIGPVFQPEKSGCWHCLTNRLWTHRHAEACAQASLGRSGPALRPVTSIAALIGVAAHFVALEATKWLAGYRYPGQSCVWTFDSFDMHGQRHELRARPQCGECGDISLVAAQARRPVILNQVRKASFGAGGHRSMTPDQILDQYQHLISPVTGIVKEITRDTRGPELLKSFRSGPNIATNVRSMRALRSSLRNQSGGKGITAVDAQAGALCEAIERYSGCFHGDEERVRGSLRSLGEQAIHPNTSLLFNDRQYATRTEWNAAHSLFQRVYEPFDEHAVTYWTPVWSLTQHRHRLLPTELLYYGASGGRSVFADSNGNAAGSSIEDAVLQGTLELVERDAVALWWYNRTPVPSVDLEAFGDPWIEQVRRCYGEMGREVWVLDVTSDLGIPAMVAVSRRSGAAREDIMFGCGAHLDPHVALRRALTELNQLIPTIPDGEFSAKHAKEDPDVVHWWLHATVSNQPYILPREGTEPRVPADFDYVPRDDLREDVEAIKAKLVERGLEMLILDQTRPDIGLPVVKVLVPGMRHFWARFAPGRLYDVPVRLGRLSEPIQYENLNPLPFFL